MTVSKRRISARFLINSVNIKVVEMYEQLYENIHISDDDLLMIVQIAVRKNLSNNFQNLELESLNDNRPSVKTIKLYDYLYDQNNLLKKEVFLGILKYFLDKHNNQLIANFLDLLVLKISEKYFNYKNIDYYDNNNGSSASEKGSQNANKQSKKQNKYSLLLIKKELDIFETIIQIEKTNYSKLKSPTQKKDFDKYLINTDSALRDLFGREELLYNGNETIIACFSSQINDSSSRYASDNYNSNTSFTPLQKSIIKAKADLVKKISLKNKNEVEYYFPILDMYKTSSSIHKLYRDIVEVHSTMAEFINDFMEDSNKRTNNEIAQKTFFFNIVRDADKINLYLIITFAKKLNSNYRDLKNLFKRLFTEDEYYIRKFDETKLQKFDTKLTKAEVDLAVNYLLNINYYNLEKR